MFNKNRVIVSEVNRYTKPVIEQLLAKYNKVTHPDFDRELREVTGIGWKQIKNYRNHPNPSTSISENSKIKNFILKKRKTDKLYKANRLTINMVSLILFCLIITVLYKGISGQSAKEARLNILLQKNLEELLGNNGLHKCSKLDDKTIKCPSGIFKRINE